MHDTVFQASFGGSDGWRGGGRLCARRFGCPAIGRWGRKTVVLKPKSPSLYRLFCPAYEKQDRISLYDAALNCARHCDYDAAQSLFEELLTLNPQFCKAWVSYAQMMRRRFQDDLPEAYDRPRRILQRAMQMNPHSACLAQAWGLLELRRGNGRGAVKLLERSVTLDPSCSPVLKWKPVQEAKEKMGPCKKRLP